MRATDAVTRAVWPVEQQTTMCLKIVYISTLHHIYRKDVNDH